MKTTPIHIQRKYYGGRDQGRRRRCDRYNEAVAVIEAHIARVMASHAEGERDEFLNFDLARATGLNLELVADVMFSIDCGHNATTVIRGKSV